MSGLFSKLLLIEKCNAVKGFNAAHGIHDVLKPDFTCNIARHPAG